MSLALVAIIWLFAFLSGAWTALGVISAVTGRVLINPSRVPWSRGEAELVGISIAIQGLAVGIYTLVGGLSLVGQLIHPFWVGRPWGVFVSAPLMLVFTGTMFFQAYVAYRHQKRVRSAG